MALFVCVCVCKCMRWPLRETVPGAKFMYEKGKERRGKGIRGEGEEKVGGGPEGRLPLLKVGW